MKNKKLNRHCPICGCNTGLVIHTQQFALSQGNPLPIVCDYVICEECGFAFSDTSVDQAGYDSYYAGMSKYEDNATSTGAGVLPWDKSRLCDLADQVAAFCPNRASRIVDIGCANGGLLAALREKGFKNVCGIDPSPACVETTRRLANGNAWVGTLSAVSLEAGSFDGVILSHVVEHVRDLSAAMDHVRNWVQGTPAGDWVSMSVPSDGSYGVPAGLISSFPCTCANGQYSIVQGLPINDFSRKMIDASVAELIDERDAVRSLGLI